MNKFVKKIYSLNYPKKIVLVGFMGSGKSTLGKKLATKLKVPFFDLDEAIVNQEELDITTIFETKGENFFRAIEHQLLKEILTSNKQFVLATGGGTPCFYNNMKLINENGTSVYLKYSPAFLSSRLIAAKKDRPLIKNYTNNELTLFIEQLLSERESIYNESNFVVNEINVKVDDVLQALKIEIV
ncbi:MAG: shikimate kinase [Vicingaceae bacterium]|nr:shikimate kinase [Vicingaceae bacterium]